MGFLSSSSVKSEIEKNKSVFRDTFQVTGKSTVLQFVKHSFV